MFTSQYVIGRFSKDIGFCECRLKYQFPQFFYHLEFPSLFPDRQQGRTVALWLNPFAYGIEHGLVGGDRCVGQRWLLMEHSLCVLKLSLAALVLVQGSSAQELTDVIVRGCLALCIAVTALEIIHVSLLLILLLPSVVSTFDGKSCLAAC